MGKPSRFVWWLVQKLAFALLLAGLMLTGLALWIFQRDQVDFDGRRQELVRALTAETGGLKAALGEVETRLASIRVEIAAQKERAEQAAKVGRQLDEFSTGLNRLTTAAAQLQENKERLARMQQMMANSLQRAAELEQTLVKTQGEKDGLEIALERKQQELSTVFANDSKMMHYARETWSAYGRWVLLAVAVVMIGPVFWQRRKAR